MGEIAPSSVSTIVPFTSLYKIKPDLCSEDCRNTFGSISQDGTWSWIARGSLLEVFSLQTNERCSLYDFGCRLKNSLPIVAVKEFSSPHIAFPCLLVALDTLSDGSLLCIFNIKTSKVTSAIHIPYNITSVEIVCNVGGATMETHTLCKQLRCFFGIVAVGTEGGNVLLLDMRLDADDFSDEVASNQSSIVSRTTHNLPSKREIASTKSQHICIYLNENNYNCDTFEYRNNDILLAQFPPGDVIVSTLKYVRSLSSLVVGFNFGGIQLWNLQHLELEISIPIHSAQQPLVHFTFQEPENDPRNFCYLWAVRGHHQGENYRPENVSVSTLYSFAFAKKEWISQYGYFYQKLESCTKRFEFPLKEEPFNPVNMYPSECSRLISCEIVLQADLMAKLDVEDHLQNEECNSCDDLGLCLLSWETWSATGKSPESSSIALFDINQWYQAQMPTRVRCNYGDTCSYLGTFSLKEVLRETNFNSIVDLSIVPNSVHRFNSLSNAEELFFPSSLSFGVSCLSSYVGAVQATYLGSQQQLLAEMNNVGPSILFDPKDLFSRCLSSGLLSLTGSTAKRQPSIGKQRELLLSLVLEHNMINFLNACVHNWKQTEFSHNGCSSNFLLEWIWKTVTVIKTTIDKLCLRLFDCSGEALDENSLLNLQIYKSRLKCLSEVLSSFQKHSRLLTEQGQHELQVRKEVVDSISIYLHVLLWLYGCKLLPEHAEGDEYGENEVAFPVTLFNRTYSYRRNEFQKMHRSGNTEDLLLIDGLIEEFGTTLVRMWKEKGGTGHYPPPSIYASVGVYLINGVTVLQKHVLMYYVILDISAYLSDRQPHLLEKLSMFCLSNNISPGLSRLTQAFWYLDHQEFETAVSLFMDPMVLKTDIAPWQHMRIVKSLLCQGHPQNAFKYISTRSPPEDTDEEVKLHMSVLLANGLIGDAFFFIRKHQNGRNVGDLLTHLFLGCQESLCLDALLHLPMNSYESSVLTSYLHTRGDPKALELLIMFYLLQSRPLEAASLNEKLTASVMEINIKSRERTAARNALVAGFVDCLPEEQRKLASELNQISAHPEKNINKVNPCPLSTNITSNHFSSMSSADLIKKLMDKQSSTVIETEEQQQTPFRNWKHKTSSTPFGGSFIADNRKRQLSPEVNNSLLPGISPLRNDKDNYQTPAKKSRSFYLPSFSLTEADYKKLKDSVNENLLSILQTPPVSRQSSRVISSFIDNTPEVVSILKRRAASHRPISPQLSYTAKTPSVCSEMSQENEPVVVSEVQMEEIEVDAAESVPTRLLRFEVPSLEKSPSPIETRATPRKPIHAEFEEANEIVVTVAAEKEEDEDICIISEVPPLATELTANQEYISLQAPPQQSDDVEMIQLEDSDEDVLCDKDFPEAVIVIDAGNVMVDVAEVEDNEEAFDASSFATPEVSFSNAEQVDVIDDENCYSNCILEYHQLKNLEDIAQNPPLQIFEEGSNHSESKEPIVQIALEQNVPCEEENEQSQNSSISVGSNSRSQFSSSLQEAGLPPILNVQGSLDPSNAKDVCEGDVDEVPELPLLEAQTPPRPVTPPHITKDDSDSSCSPYLGTRSRSRSNSVSPSRSASNDTPRTHIPRSVSLFTATAEAKLKISPKISEGDANIPIIEAELPTPEAVIHEKKQVPGYYSSSPYLGTRSKSRSPARKLPVKNQLQEKPESGAEELHKDVSKPKKTEAETLCLSPMPVFTFSAPSEFTSAGTDIVKDGIASVDANLTPEFSTPKVVTASRTRSKAAHKDASETLKIPSQSKKLDQGDLQIELSPPFKFSDPCIPADVTMDDTIMSLNTTVSENRHLIEPAPPVFSTPIKSERITRSKSRLDHTLEPEDIERAHPHIKSSPPFKFSEPSIVTQVEIKTISPIKDKVPVEHSSSTAEHSKSERLRKNKARLENQSELMEVTMEQSQSLLESSELFKFSYPSNPLDVTLEKPISPAEDKTFVKPVPVSSTPVKSARIRTNKSKLDTVSDKIETPVERSSEKKNSSLKSVSLSKHKIVKKNVKSSKKSEFTFSKPSTSADAEILEVLSSSPSVPVQSFLFSPPASRTRGRERRLMESMNASSILDTSIVSLSPPDLKQPDPVNRSIRRKKPGAKSKRNVSTQNTTSPQINFISPVLSSVSTEDNEDELSAARAKHRMILRKSIKAKKKTVQLFF